MMRADLLRKALIAEAVHINDMENLPDGWQLARLGDVCTLINGRAFTPKEWSKEGLPIIRIQNLNNPKAECFRGSISED